MSIACPNKNLPEWKSLVSVLGEVEAIKEYVKNGYDIPSIDKIKANPFYGKSEYQIKQYILTQANANNGFVNPSAYTTLEKLVNKLTQFAGRRVFYIAQSSAGTYYLKQIANIQDVYMSVDSEFNVDEFKQRVSNLVIDGFSARNQEAIIDFITYRINRKIIDLMATNQGQTVSEKWEFLFGDVKNYFQKQGDKLRELGGYEPFVAQFDSIQANWPKFQSLVSQNLTKLFGIQTIDEYQNVLSEPEMNESLIYDTFDDDATFQINHKTKLSKVLKQFLSGIADAKLQYNEDGSYQVLPETNYLGLVQPVSYSTVYEAIMDSLQGSANSFDEIMVRLQNAIPKYPFMKNVVDHLKTAPENIKNVLQYNMIKHEIKMKYIYHVQADGRNTYNTLNSNSTTAARLTMSEWQDNFLDNEFLTANSNGEINIETKSAKFKNLLSKFDSWKVAPDAIEFNSWLIDLGIILDPKTVNQIVTTGLSRKQGGTIPYPDLFKGQGLFAQIYQNLKAQTNDLDFAQSSYFNKVRGLYGLALIDSNNRKRLHTNSFRDGEGKMVWGYTNTRFYIDRYFDLLNNKNGVVDSLLTFPFNSTSILLNKLKNKDQKFIDTLDYFFFDVYRESRSKYGVKFDEQAENIHEITKIAMFQNRGSENSDFAYETLSDKKKMFGLSMPKFTMHTDDGRPISWFNIKDELSLQTIDFVYSNVVLPEINRILHVQQNNIKINNREFDNGSNLFYFFPSLNNISELYLDDYIFEFDEKSNAIQKNGTLRPDVTTGQYKQLITDAIAKDLKSLIDSKLNNWIESGITIQNMDTDYISKVRATNSNNKLRYAAADMEINYILFNTNLHQAFIGDPALYYKGNQSSEFITQVKDTFNNLGKRLAGDNASGSKPAEAENDTFNTLVLSDRVTSQSKYIKQLKDITGTDAQELTTLDEHLYLLERQGSLTAGQTQKIREARQVGRKLTAREIRAVLQPVKPVFVANILDNEHKVEKRVYIKSSSFPIIPELVEDLEMESLLEFMEKHKVNRVAFKTAVKVGSPTPLNIWTSDGQIKDLTDVDPSGSMLYNLPRTGFKVQQEVPFDESKASINDGTQQRKLLFVDNMDTSGFDYRGKEHTGAQLKNKMNAIYKEIFRVQYEAFREELSIDDKGNVDIVKLQEILNNEAKSRDYFINERLGLSIEGNEFTIPLWLNSASDKFESLLNSLVDNAIRKIKVNGKSFVLGTQEGLQPKSEVKSLEELSKNQKSRIVYTSEFNIEAGLRPMRIEGNQVMPAEIMIPFKFKDNFGDLMKIEDFTDENGIISNDKLPAELREAFGFRIPTQGLESMSYVKVVAFLPESYGDLVIAPREFTKQMGSDFDIDKLYSTMYNYYVQDEYHERNKNQAEIEAKYQEWISTSKPVGSIVVRKDFEHFSDRIARRDFAASEGLYYDLKSKKFFEKIKDRKLVKIDFKTKEEVEALNDQLVLEYAGMLDFRDPKTKTTYSLVRVLDKAWTKSLENRLMDVHKAVMLNPKLFDKINSPLGYGDLKNDTPDSMYHKMARIKEVKSGSQTFNALSSEYQKQKYLNARGAKVGVGSLSTDSTFNASVQRASDEDPIRHGFWTTDKDGGSFFVETKVVFGTEKSNAISNINTSDGKALKSDEIKAWQSGFVDDENEQIMGMLNITTTKLDAIRAMNQLGFRTKTTVAFINQPAIELYVKEYDRAISKFRNKSKAYTAGVEAVVKKYITPEIRNAINEATARKDNSLLKLADIGFEDMWKNVENDEVMTDSNYRIQQYYMVMKFLRLTDIGTDIKSVQSTINIDSAGLSSSLIQNYDKYLKVQELGSNKNFTNVSSLIGDYDYSDVGLKIDPKTINGHASVYALGTNNLIWSNYYPYLKLSFSSITQAILSMNRNKDKSDTEVMEMIGQHLRSFVYASNSINLVDSNVNTERDDLLYDKYVTVVNNQGVKSKNRIHDSLGTIINAIKKTKYGLSNSFLQNLYVRRQLNENSPAELYISTNGIDKYQDDIMYRGMIEMLASNKVIGEYNGKEYTSTMLAEDLIKYQFLTGARQQATQFTKYIPIDYMITKGIAAGLRGFTIDSQFANRFIKQFIQHNVELTTPNVTGQFEVKSSIHGVPVAIKLDEETPSDFVHTVSEVGIVRLYQFDPGLSAHIMIDKLGTSIGTEYNTGTDMQLSSNPENKSLVKIQPMGESAGEVIHTALPVHEESVYNTNGGIQGIVGQIINTTTNPLFKLQAQEFARNIKHVSDVELMFKELPSGTDGFYDGKNKRIVLSNKLITNKSKFEKVFLHEMTHAFINDKLANPTTAEQRALVDRINNLWQSFKLNVDQEKLQGLITKIENRRTKIVRGLGDDNLGVTKEEAEILYAAINVEEFAALVMTSEELQKLLDETPHEGDKSFWQELLDLFNQVLVSMGFKKESQFTTAYSSIISLINSLDNDSLVHTSVLENAPIEIPGIGQKFDNIFVAFESFRSGEYNYDYHSKNTGLELNDATGDEQNFQERMDVLVDLQMASNPQLIDKLRGLTVRGITDDIPNSWKKMYVDAVNNYYMKYGTHMSIAASEDQIRNSFGLYSRTGKTIRVNNGTIANIINSMYSNATANIKNNGTSYDIHMSVSASDIDKSSTLLRNLKSRKQVLYKALAQSDLANNQMLSDDLRRRISEIETDELSIKDNVKLEDIQFYASKDIEDLKNRVNAGMSISDIFYSDKIVHMWINAIDTFFSIDEKNSSTLVEEFRKIEGTMYNYRDQLSTLKFMNMKEIMTSELGHEIDIEQMFSMMKDTNRGVALGLDISRAGNPMYSGIYRMVKKANYDAQGEAEKIHKKVDELVPRVRSEMKNLGLKSDFSIFQQEFADGKKTGNLVFKYTQEYFDMKKKLHSAAKRKNNVETWNRYFNWLNANTITFDVRKLVPTNDGDLYQYGEKFDVAEIQKHKDELKTNIGEVGYKHLIDRLEAKVSDFKDAYKSYYDSIVTDSENITEEQRDQLELWDKTNSPYWYSHYSNDNKVPVHGGKTIKPRGYEYTYNTPRRFYNDGTNTNWYDTKFDTIEGNETLSEFYYFMIDVLRDIARYIPEHKKKDLQINTLPEIHKTILDEFSEDGMKAGLAGIWDRVIMSIRTDDISQYTNKYYDPETGETEPELKVEYLNDNAAEVKDLVEKKVALYKIQNNYAQVNDETYDLFVREAKDEIASRKSNDLGKIIKAYSLMGLAYKHKAKIEDVVRLGKAIVNEVRETDRTPDGKQKMTTEGVVHKLPTQDSFKNMKDMYQYYYDSFFGKSRKLEGATTKKVYTSEEKEQKKVIEDNLLKLKLDYDRGDVSKAEFEELESTLQEKLSELGGNRAASKIGDQAIKYMQLKSMAWNPFGAISNIGYGYVSNIINAGDGRDYSKKDIMRAYKLIITSMVKNATFNKVESDTAKKIRSLMDKLDILKDMSNDVYKTSKENTVRKGMRWLEPYNMQKRGEYINQGTIMMAMMFNTKVETPEGEINLWDLFDKDGNVKVGTEEQYAGLISNFRMKIDQVNKKVHGNYDTLSPLMVQKTFLGRAGIQFRKWLLEGIANAFQNEKYDDILGYSRKGRYRTAIDTLITGKVGDSRLSNLKYTGNALASKLLFGLYKIKDNEALSDVDKANIRANMTTLIVYMQLITLALLIKAFAGDDEDEKAKYARNYLINHLTRLQTDISFYTSPQQFEALTVNPIPVTSLVTDFYDVTDAIYRSLKGDDTIQSGIYAGESRLLRETSQMLPLGSSVYRNLSASMKEY